MYTHARDEIHLQAPTGELLLDLTSTGDKAVWGPGMVAFTVRGCAIVPNATPGDAGVVKLDKRITRGSDTNRTDGTIGVLNLATAHTVTAGSAGRVIYKDFGADAVTLYPGEELVAEVTDASASVNAARIILWGESEWKTFGAMPTLSGTTMTASS